MALLACLNAATVPTQPQRQNAGEMRGEPARGSVPTWTQPAWLSQAVHDTVHRVRGTAKVIAFTLDRAEKYVTDLADVTRRVPLKAHEIVPIVLSTHDYTILDVIEAKVGRVAFTLPPTNPNLDDMNRELARDIQIFGEMLTGAGEVLADGVIDSYERTRLLAQIDKVLAGVSELRELVIHKAERDGAEARR